MKHKRFEENILVDEAYTNYGKVDKNEDRKTSKGIAKNFAESLEYDEQKKWYHQLPQEPPTIDKTLTTDQIEELKKEASSALHGDTLAYETKANRNGSSDHQWAKTLLTKGAIGDRVAAATILIQENPLYNLSALRNLISNVKPAKKKDGITIIDTLSELLVNDLLIPDLKLRTFEQHALAYLDDMTSGNKQAKRNILKLWYYEDQLKEMYGTYIDALNKFAHDTVDANKEKSVTAMAYLLMHHPEREKMLLTYIINKLGDPSSSVASKVIYHLCQLLFNHPNMKSVVMAEIEKMLFRTNISQRAQYYGICFLNQFYLGKDDSKIAENLIRVYFAFFKASIKKGDINSKLMSAILTGVKRAFPFADKERIAEISTHVDGVHKLVHLSRLNVAIHALALLFQISDASPSDQDRYYTSLYRKIANIEIYNTTHSALLYNLIYKSLKKDTNVPRIASFIKRLMQSSCYLSPNKASALLLLVSQVLKDGEKDKALLLTFEAREEKLKPEPIEVTDETVLENGENDPTLDTSVEEIKETKKIDLLHGDKKDLLMDDDEETYVDLKIDDEGNIKPKKKIQNQTKPGWFHSKINKPDEVDDKKEIESKIQLRRAVNSDKVVSEYNPAARNPSYAGADKTAFMELLLLEKHYHPTVQLFAQQIINSKIIQYSGDPLKDFAGIRFLDRFVFKNPKKRETAQNEDGPKTVKGSHPTFAVRKNYCAKGLKSMRVNSSTYLREDPSKIPVDERFLYDFLQKRREADDSDDDSDKESISSEDFEHYLDSITGQGQDGHDDELDFMSEMKAATKEKKNSEKKDLSDEDDELDDDGDDDDMGDDISDNDGSDGGLEIDGDDDEPELSADEHELDLDGDSDDNIDVPETKSKKKLGFKLKGKDDLSSLFASAEEFSTILEDTATNKKQGSSQAVSNTDNSSAKQLAWEDKRNTWIKGYNSKILGKKHGGKKFGGKNKNEGRNKMGNKGGKRKGDSVSVGGKRRKK